MRFLLGVLMLMISGSALATIDVLQFKDEAQEQQFRQLTEELRCPKCQNNSIADSNSMIATDLRQKVYELMQEGKSKKEIVDYMVARYGNFVTYDPPLTPLTVLLWVLPVVAIGIGGWVIYARSRRRVRVVPEAFPEQSVPEGKRAGCVVYLPGIVVALIVAGVSYYQTGNYQQVKNLAAGHGTGSGVTGQGAGSESRSAQRRRDVAPCAGDAYSTAKKSGRYRRLDYVGPRWHGAG